MIMTLENIVTEPEATDETEYMVLYLNTRELDREVVFGVATLDWEEANQLFNDEADRLIAKGWLDVGASKHIGFDRANALQLCTYPSSNPDHRIIKEFEV